MSQGRAVWTLTAVFTLGLVAWVTLGGLDELGKWPVPDGVLGSLDMLVKGSMGSLLTLITQRHFPAITSTTEG